MIRDYKKFVDIVFNNLKDTQFKNIIDAGVIIAKNASNGGYFWAFGPGHSHEMVETMMENNGSLSFMKPVFVQDLGRISLYNEQIESFGNVIVNSYDFKQGDTLLIISNSGINGATVEVGKVAKEKGLTLIASSSLIQSRRASSRHSSGLKLFELADITIDNCGEYNDAAFEVKPDMKMGATSGAVGIFISHALNLIVHTICHSNNLSDKDLFNSKINLEINDELLLNKLNEYFEKYTEVLNETFEANIDQLKKAAKLAALAIKKEKTSYLYGAGHDHCLCEEITSRAGTIMVNRAMIFGVLQLQLHPTLWKEYMRIEECDQSAFNTITFDSEDSFFMFSQSSNEPANVSMAKYIVDKGVKLMLLTNINMAKSLKASHSSGQKLYDIADLVIDIKAPYNDSLLQVGDLSVAPCFQSVASFMLQAFVILQALELDQMGIQPPVRKSVNTDEGKEWNAELNRKYGHLTRL